VVAERQLRTSCSVVSQDPQQGGQGESEQADADRPGAQDSGQQSKRDEGTDG
jgi:hypothetical protein